MVIRVVRGAGIACTWLLLWQGLSVLVGSPFLLPSPIETVMSLLRMAGESSFWQSAGLSMLRVLAGFGAAVVFGVLLGVMSAMLPAVDALFKPLRSLIKATPVVSFTLLVQLWMQSTVIPAFMGFLMVLPLVWTNTQQGINATDGQLIEMARLFRVSRYRVLRDLYFPSVLPYFLSACATGLGFAWKAAVAAEVIGRTAQSIGKSLIESKNSLETGDMFAWTALVVMLSMLFERLMLQAIKRVASSRANA